MRFPSVSSALFFFSTPSIARIHLLCLKKGFACGKQAKLQQNFLMGKRAGTAKEKGVEVHVCGHCLFYPAAHEVNFQSEPLTNAARHTASGPMVNCDERENGATKPKRKFFPVHLYSVQKYLLNNEIAKLKNYRTRKSNSPAPYFFSRQPSVLAEFQYLYLMEKPMVLLPASTINEWPLPCARAHCTGRKRNITRERGQTI